MPARSIRSAPDRLATTTIAMVVAVAVLSAAVGVWMLTLMLRERVAASNEISLGGLSLQVLGGTWQKAEDEGQQQETEGFQMPPQMMPGAPAPGDQRLEVRVALGNRGDSLEAVRAEEFSILIPAVGSWPVKVDSLGIDRLRPGLAINGALQFDLPSAKIPKDLQEVTLVWAREGGQVQVPVRVGQAPADAGHH
jgi:hypothetical protein